MEDDVSQKRLERVEQKVDGLSKSFERQAVRFEQVHGLVQAVRHEAGVFRQELGDQLDSAATERRAHHAEQMKAFQAVIAEVRSDRDRKIAELESDVTALKAQVAELLRARRQ
jgi:chromosome segregation ATPase